MMFYWNKSNFEGLKAAGKQYASKTGYEDFANYCLFKEKGLKKQANQSYVGGNQYLNMQISGGSGLITMPKEFSPVRDLTGKVCNIQQRGDVWFLVGGYGSSTM
jgi:hypothetical protein